MQEYLQFDLSEQESKQDQTLKKVVDNYLDWLLERRKLVSTYCQTLDSVEVAELCRRLQPYPALTLRDILNELEQRAKVQQVYERMHQAKDRGARFKAIKAISSQLTRGQTTTKGRRDATI